MSETRFRMSPPPISAAGGVGESRPRPGEPAPGAPAVPAFKERLRNGVKRALQTAVERSPLGRSLFWHVPGGAGVALTFDDGPDPIGTPRVLDLLRERGARATFFLVGERARRHPELVRRIAAEGHQVGNHTDTHPRCSDLLSDELWEEVERADETLRSLCPELETPLFRPPWGALRPVQIAEVAARGRTAVLWSVDSRDYRGVAAEEILRRCAGLRDGDIVLLHERFAATWEALPRLLEQMDEQGLRAVPAAAGANGPIREEGIGRWSTRSAA